MIDEGTGDGLLDRTGLMSEDPSVDRVMISSVDVVPRWRFSTSPTTRPRRHRTHRDGSLPWPWPSGLTLDANGEDLDQRLLGAVTCLQGRKPATCHGSLT